MAKQRKGLGNLGVDALLSTKSLETYTKPYSTSDSYEFTYLGVERIRPNRYQPRIRIDEQGLEELARSMREQGLIQPVVVRALPGKPNNYELITGERRWRAAQRIGLEQIPAVIRQADEQQAAILSLVENIQRAELNALEEAAALQNTIEQFSLTHEAVAALIGRSRTTVTNLIRLLELDDRVQQLLNEGMLEMGHARVLLRLKKNKQAAAAQKIVQQKMTVRQTEIYVAHLLKGKPPSPKTTRAPEITALERKLTERLNTPVQIKHQESGGGKLIIRYTNLAVLDGILEKIR